MGTMQLTPVGSDFVGREEGVCIMLYLADRKKSGVYDQSIKRAKVSKCKSSTS